MVRNVVILGGGSQAVTLAMALMQSGFSSTLIEPDPDAAERARFFLGRLQGGQGPSVVSDVTALHNADIVFEAIDDDPALRSESLIDLKPHIPDHALLATIVLRDLPAALHGLSSIGFHLFAPAHIRRLVEITPGPETSAETLQAASDLARDMGRVPILAPPARLNRHKVGTAVVLGGGHIVASRRDPI
jgi:3-hydroxyacyl-CoA dehydrogenase